MNTKKAVIIFLILAVTAFAVYEYVFQNMNGFKRDSDFRISYDITGKSDFYVYNKKVFYLTNDGIQRFDQNGKNLWSDTFNMSSPVMITDSGIVAVMEKNGRTVRLYKENGPVSTIDSDNPIISASVNSIGNLCVITKSETYYLNVYNQNGEKIFDGNFAASDGLPLCSDISDDGKILSVCFLDINDINLKSRVCFYYIGETNLEHDTDSDYMFASYIEEDSVVGVLSFMENNCVAVLSDNELSIISLNPTASEKYKQNLKYEFANQITAADLSNKRIVAIALGEAGLNSKNPLKSHTVKLFNCKGSEIGSYEAEKNIDALKTSGNNVLISMGRAFAAIDYKGSLIWEYKAIQDIKDIFFLSSAENILLVSINEAVSVNINSIKSNENLPELNNQEESSENQSEQPPEEEPVSQSDEVSSAEQQSESVANE